jgi:serine/threonine-protein kinase RsbW
MKGIIDDGIPFNPIEKKITDIERFSDKPKIGGLGIHMVRNLTDKFTYHRRDGNNQVILVKKLEKDNNT